MEQLSMEMDPDNDDQNTDDPESEGIVISEIISSAILDIQRKAQLVDEVEKCPWLWDRNHDDYPDRERKRETWSSIGAVLNAPPEECRKCWTNYKDIYYRKRRLANPVKWQLFDRLKFLEVNFSIENEVKVGETMKLLLQDAKDLSGSGTELSDSKVPVLRPYKKKKKYTKYRSTSFGPPISSVEDLINKDKLIIEVKRRPSVWAQDSEVGIPGRKGRNKEWNEISNAINLPVKECKRMWKNLKDIYARVRRQKHPTWKLYNLLQFLEPTYPPDEKYFDSDDETFNSVPQPKLSHEEIWNEVKVEPSSEPFSQTSLSEHIQEIKLFSLSKTKCLICLCETDFEKSGLRNALSTPKKRKALQELKISSTRALCRLFGLDQDLGEIVEKSTFCFNCYEQIMNIEYMTKCLKSIQSKLASAKARIERRLGAEQDLVRTAERQEEDACSPVSKKRMKIETQVTVPTPSVPPKPMKYSRSGRPIHSPKKFEPIIVSEYVTIDTKPNLSLISEDEDFCEPEPDAMNLSENEYHDSDENEDSKASPSKRKRTSVIVNANRRDEYQCPRNECHTFFRSANQLKAHICKVHENDPLPFHCEEDIMNCTAKFGTLATLRVHVARDHRNEQAKFTCKFCDKSFYKRGDMKTHVKCVHNEYNLRPKCSICTKSWTDKSTEEEIKSHEELHQATDCNPCLCVICHAGHFQSAWELQRHVQAEHEEGLYKCSYCGTVFVSKVRLEKHTKIRHSDLREGRSHVCDYPGCNFKALSDSALKHHAIKHGEKEFKCDFPGCDKAYKWASALRIHTRKMHTLDRPFGCSFCPKRFVIRSEAMNHEVYHSQIRPYMCDQCPISFKTQRNLQNHKKFVHDRPQLADKKRITSKPKTNRRGSKKLLRVHVQHEPIEEEVEDQEIQKILDTDKHTEEATYEELEQYGGIQYQITDVGSHTTHTIISTEGEEGISMGQNGNIVLTLPPGTTDFPGPAGTSYSLIIAPYGELSTLVATTHTQVQPDHEEENTTSASPTPTDQEQEQDN